MYMNPIIHCLIPARSGSKGLPNKNIKLLTSKHLIGYSIELALQSPLISKVVVSTDSPYYAEIAKEYGAEVPFLRPADISQDKSTDLEFMKHYLLQCQINSWQYPDAILHLRPTYPCRNIVDLEACITTFIKNWSEYDSIRSVIVSPKTPYKMYRITDQKLVPLYSTVDGINEPYNQARQVLPKTYMHNGCYDIVKSEVIMKYHSMSGQRIYPFVMKDDEQMDIDTEEDFKKARLRMSMSSLELNNK